MITELNPEDSYVSLLNPNPVLSLWCFYSFFPSVLYSLNQSLPSQNLQCRRGHTHLINSLQNDSNCHCAKYIGRQLLMSGISRHFPEIVHSQMFPLMTVFSCKMDILGLQAQPLAVEEEKVN